MNSLINTKMNKALEFTNRNNFVLDLDVSGVSIAWNSINPAHYRLFVIGGLSEIVKRDKLPKAW